MTDRDLQIGGLLSSVESLKAQNADQFRRIDALEVAVGKLEERCGGAPSRIAAVAQDWRLWVTLVGAAGSALGWWSWSSVEAP